MGGYGSGRRSFSCAGTCEDSHRIDLAYLSREKLLRPGASTTLAWSSAGERTGSVGLATESAGVRLTYTASDHNGAKVRINEFVPFTYTATRFGGRRLWFACLGCYGRCRVIYGGRYFRCRQCHGLYYQSQREADYDRALKRADRIRNRLGDQMFGAFEVDELPPKPPRMRWKTYGMLERQYAQLQARWKAGAGARYGTRF